MAGFQKKFTAYDIFTTCISTLSYVADVITDILLIVVFFLNGDQIWGSLTLGFVTASNLMMLIFSFQWHMADKTLTPGNFIAHILFLSPVHRYIHLLRLGLKAKHSNDESLSEAAFRELNDICILRLFETFLESTPQLVLQLYIILKFQQFGVVIGISAACSLLSIGWSVTAYNDALRLACRKYYKRNWPGMISQTLCQIGMMVSRVLAVVLFSAVFQTWIFLPIGIHWLAMVLWIRHQKPDFGSTSCERSLFTIVAATVYIFCFINLKDGRSRWRLLTYYSLVLLESSLFVALWMIYKDVSTPLWYSITAFTVIYGGFLLGAVCMLVYYGCFHPSGPVSLSPKACQTICIVQDQIQDNLKTRACYGSATLDHPNLWLNASHDLSAVTSHSEDAVQFHPEGKFSPRQQCSDNRSEFFFNPGYYINKNSTMYNEVSSQPETCYSLKRARSSENSSLDQSKSKEKLPNSIIYSTEDRIYFASNECSPQYYCEQGNPNPEYVTAKSAALTTRSQKQNFSKNKLFYNKAFGADLSPQRVSCSEFTNNMLSQRNHCNSSSCLSNTVLDRTNISNQNNSLFLSTSAVPLPGLETSEYSSASHYSLNSLSPLDPHKLWEELKGRVNSIFYTSPSLSSLPVMGVETNKDMGTSFKKNESQTVIVQETDLDAYSSKYVIVNRVNNMDNEYSSKNNSKVTLMMNKPDLIQCTSGNCNSSMSSIQSTHMYSDTLTQDNNNFISLPNELSMSQYSLSVTGNRKRSSPKDRVDRSRSVPCTESLYQMASGNNENLSNCSQYHSEDHHQHTRSENQSSTDSGMLPHSSHSTSPQSYANDSFHESGDVDVFYKDRRLSSFANSTTQSRSEMSSHGQSSDSGMSIQSPGDEELQKRYKGDSLSTVPESYHGPGFSESYLNISPPYSLPEIGSRTVSRLCSDRSRCLLNKASQNFRFFKDPRSPVPVDTDARPRKDSDVSNSMDKSDVTNFSDGERRDSFGFYQDKSSLSAYISGLSSDIGMEDTSSSDELFAEQDSTYAKLYLREKSKSLANIEQEPISSQCTIREKSKSGSDLSAETENCKIESSNITYQPRFSDASEFCTDTSLNIILDPLSDTPWRVDYMNSSLPKQTLSEMYTQLSETSCMKLGDSRYSHEAEMNQQTSVQKQVTGRETRKSLFTAGSLEMTPTKMEHYDFSPHKLGRSVDLFNRSAWRASLDKEQQMRMENSFVGKSLQSKILYDVRAQKTRSPLDPQISDLVESPYRFRYSDENEDGNLSQLSGNKKSFDVDLSQKGRGGQNENQAQSDTSSSEVDVRKDSLSSGGESYQGVTERGLYSSFSFTSDQSDKHSSASNSVTPSLIECSRSRKSLLNISGINSAFRPVKPRKNDMPKSSNSITFSVHKLDKTLDEGQRKNHTYINTPTPLKPLDSSDKENLAPDAKTLSSFEDSSSSFQWSKLSTESDITGTSLQDKSSINYLRMAGHTSLSFSHASFPQMGNPSFLSNHSQTNSIPWEDSANISNSIHQSNMHEQSHGNTLPMSTSKRQPLKSLDNTPGVSPILDKSLHTSLELSSQKYFMSTPKFSTESEVSSHRNLKNLSSVLELHQSRRSSGIGANTPNHESSSWSSQQDFENLNFTELDKNNCSSLSTYV